jgi:hypothetical protein
MPIWRCADRSALTPSSDFGETSWFDATGRVEESDVMPSHSKAPSGRHIPMMSLLNGAIGISAVRCHKYAGPTDFATRPQFTSSFPQNNLRLRPRKFALVNGGQLFRQLKVKTGLRASTKNEAMTIGANYETDT